MMESREIKNMSQASGLPEWFVERVAQQREGKVDLQKLIADRPATEYQRGYREGAEKMREDAVLYIKQQERQARESAGSPSVTADMQTHYLGKATGYAEIVENLKDIPITPPQPEANAECVGCEGSPKQGNSPCSVRGKVLFPKYMWPHLDYGKYQVACNDTTLQHGDVVEVTRKVNGRTVEQRKATFRLLDAGMYEPEWVAENLPKMKAAWKEKSK